MGWDPAHVQVRGVTLAEAQKVSLLMTLGRGRLVRGSGGYVYRVFGNGYIEIVAGTGGVGRLLLPRGDAGSWGAVRQEVG